MEESQLGLFCRVIVLLHAERCVRLVWAERRAEHLDSTCLQDPVHDVEKNVIMYSWVCNCQAVKPGHGKHPQIRFRSIEMCLIPIFADLRAYIWPPSKLRKTQHTLKPPHVCLFSCLLSVALRQSSFYKMRTGPHLQAVLPVDITCWWSLWRLCVHAAHTSHKS